MTQSRDERDPKAAGTGAMVRPTPGALAAIVALGLASALWTLFQWTQLIAARTGGSSFCGLGDSTACAEIWDSGFATGVQEWTGLPVAGWGLAWSLGASFLPLWALMRRAGRGRAEEPSPAWVATVWMALAGVGAVLLLAGVSIAYGSLCTTCALTYALTTAYAATCFVQTPPHTLPLARGVSPAVLSLALGFALLFVPGLRTPMSRDAEARKALLQVAGEQAAERRVDEPAPGSAEAEAAEDPMQRLRQLLQELPPQLRQLFADELLRYASADPVPARPPRALLGPEDAPVRLTQFTDALCGHCANLHETLSQLRTALPAGSFAIESRHFPLDSACNPALEGDSAHPVRCLAAAAKICLEGREGAFDYAHRLYLRQSGLNEEDVYGQVEPWMSRDELERCIESPATDARLEEDIAWALEHDIEGTPLVLINGRPVAPFGPLLYALILTRGDADHPIFDSLPDGVLRDPHAGHDH